MKNIFFLSGLPRSGSTLLGSLLSQNPDITVSPTSPLLDLLCSVNVAFDTLIQQYTFDVETVSKNVYSGLIENFYKHINTDIIIDKHRGHPKNIKPLKMFVTDNPKIICTYRPIAEVITSYIVLIEKNKQEDNFVDNSLRKKNIPVNTTNRAQCLWEEYMSDSYKSMIDALQNNRECLHIITYDELTNTPDIAINKIYDFLGLPYYTHKYSNIYNYCAEEKDEAWGLHNLHTIRTELKKISTPPEQVLGSYLTDYYNQYNLVY